jgi:hypothetical protein
VLLGEAAAVDHSMLDLDSGLVPFLADMRARIDLCIHSIREFDLFDPVELSKCQESIAIVDASSEQLKIYEDYDQHLELALNTAYSEYEGWAVKMIEKRVEPGV